MKICHEAVCTKRVIYMQWCLPLGFQAAEINNIINKCVHLKHRLISISKYNELSLIHDSYCLKTKLKKSSL